MIAQAKGSSFQHSMKWAREQSTTTPSLEDSIITCDDADEYNLPAAVFPCSRDSATDHYEGEASNSFPRSNGGVIHEIPSDRDDLISDRQIDGHMQQFFDETKGNKKQPVLDLPSMLDRCGGDPELLDGVLNSFFEQGGRRLESLRDAISICNWDVAFFDAEFLRGSCQNVCALRVLGTVEELLQYIPKCPWNPKSTTTSESIPSPHLQGQSRGTHDQHNALPARLFVEAADRIATEFFRAKRYWKSQIEPSKQSPCFCTEYDAHEGNTIGLAQLARSCSPHRSEDCQKRDCSTECSTFPCSCRRSSEACDCGNPSGYETWRRRPDSSPCNPTVSSSLRWEGTGCPHSLPTWPPRGTRLQSELAGGTEEEDDSETEEADSAAYESVSTAAGTPLPTGSTSPHVSAAGHSDKCGDRYDGGASPSAAAEDDAAPQMDISTFYEQARERVAAMREAITRRDGQVVLAAAAAVRSLAAAAGSRSVGLRAADIARRAEEGAAAGCQWLKPQDVDVLEQQLDAAAALWSSCGLRV